MKIFLIENMLENCEIFDEFDYRVFYIKRLRDGKMFFTKGIKE
jgi:hypothetical protein